MLPAVAAGLLFGIKGVRSGRDLLNTGKGIFRKLNPEAKPMKIKKPQGKQIKTAKPMMIKPKVNKVEVSPKEKEQVMSWYGLREGPKASTSLAPKANATLAPAKIKGASKRKATMAGQKLAAKAPGSVMFDSQGALKKELSGIKY